MIKTAPTKEAYRSFINVFLYDETEWEDYFKSELNNSGLSKKNFESRMLRAATFFKNEFDPGNDEVTKKLRRFSVPHYIPLYALFKAAKIDVEIMDVIGDHISVDLINRALNIALGNADTTPQLKKENEIEPLTEDEKRIAKMLKGCSYTVISKRVFKGKKTIQRTVNKICDKYDLPHDKGLLITFIEENGLVL